MKMTDIALARAQAAARQAQPNMAHQGGPQIGYAFETVLEPNEAALARIRAQIQAAKDAGIEPPDGFDLGPEDQDVVVYEAITVTSSTTPGGLAIPGGKLAQARLRGNLIKKMPLKEVLERAGAKFQEQFGGG